MHLALKAMLKAAQMASRNFVGGDLPPPYTPPTSGWYMAPPPAYSANPAGYQVRYIGTYCIHVTCIAMEIFKLMHNKKKL
jgi:hypothetical protein